MLKMKTVYRLKDYDFFLVICVIVLSGIDVLLIGSASQPYQIRQIAGIMQGIYAAALVLLLNVTIAGAISGGAARWIEISRFGSSRRR